MRRERAVAEAVTRKFAEVIRLRDESLADHLHRTAEVACAVGAQLGADMDTLDLLYTAGFLHDVGKLAISEAILWKPSGLTRAEWRVVRAHPEEGHRLVEDIMEREVASAVLNHHERMDGEGYPRGLDGRTLPMVARIVQVADAWDAMTNHRPYRPALPTPDGSGRGAALRREPVRLRGGGRPGRDLRRPRRAPSPEGAAPLPRLPAVGDRARDAADADQASGSISLIPTPRTVCR